MRPSVRETYLVRGKDAQPGFEASIVLALSQSLFLQRISLRQFAGSCYTYSQQYRKVNQGASTFKSGGDLHRDKPLYYLLWPLRQLRYQQQH